MNMRQTQLKREYAQRSLARWQENLSLLESNKTDILIASVASGSSEHTEQSSPEYADQLAKGGLSVLNLNMDPKLGETNIKQRFKEDYQNTVSPYGSTIESSKSFETHTSNGGLVHTVLMPGSFGETTDVGIEANEWTRHLQAYLDKGGTLILNMYDDGVGKFFYEFCRKNRAHLGNRLILVIGHEQGEYCWIPNKDYFEKNEQLTWEDYSKFCSKDEIPGFQYGKRLLLPDITPTDLLPDNPQIAKKLYTLSYELRDMDGIKASWLIIKGISLPRDEKLIETLRAKGLEVKHPKDGKIDILVNLKQADSIPKGTNPGYSIYGALNLFLECVGKENVQFSHDFLYQIDKGIREKIIYVKEVSKVYAIETDFQEAERFSNFIKKHHKEGNEAYNKRKEVLPFWEQMDTFAEFEDCHLIHDLVKQYKVTDQPQSAVKAEPAVKPDPIPPAIKDDIERVVNKIDTDLENNLKNRSMSREEYTEVHTTVHDAVSHPDDPRTLEALRVTADNIQRNPSPVLKSLGDKLMFLCGLLMIGVGIGLMVTGVGSVPGMGLALGGGSLSLFALGRHSLFSAVESLRAAQNTRENVPPHRPVR